MPQYFALASLIDTLTMVAGVVLSSRRGVMRSAADISTERSNVTTSCGHRRRDERD